MAAAATEHPGKREEEEEEEEKVDRERRRDREDGCSQRAGESVLERESDAAARLSL